MFTWLERIFHGILDLPYLLINLLIESVNGWILIIATLVGALLSVLPGFPALPEVPNEIAGYVSYFLPIAGLMVAFGAFLSAWLLWRGMQVVLRWGKVVQ